MKDTINSAKEKMNKSLNALGNEFASIRAGRANPAVLDKVMVDYYGAPTPVNQMAAVSVQQATILVIQPWDKSTLKLIEKAVLASDLGITPTNDGSVIVSIDLTSGDAETPIPVTTEVESMLCRK